jgi:hypothetical protein
MKCRTNQQSRGIEFSQLKNDCSITCLNEDDGKWYFSKILERDEERVEVKVQFFKPAGEEYTQRGFQLSNKKDVAFVPMKNILKIVESFKKSSSRAKNFHVSQEELTTIACSFSRLIQDGQL